MSQLPLMQGEAIVYQGRINPLFRGLAVMAIVSLVVCAVSSPVGIFFLLCCGINGISQYIKYTTSIFLVTNKRVIIRVGAFTHQSLELNLSKVESVYVQTGILDRANNMGTLVVVGTGGTKEAFKNLADPNVFKLKLQELLDQLSQNAHQKLAS